MSIESNLKTLAENTTRIADALEKLSAISISSPDEAEAEVKVEEKTTKPKPKPKPEPEIEKDPLEESSTSIEITKEDVRKALMDYRDIEGSPAMLEMLAANGDGATGIKDLDEANYAAVYNAATKIANK